MSYVLHIIIEYPWTDTEISNCINCQMGLDAIIDANMYTNFPDYSNHWPTYWLEDRPYRSAKVRQSFYQYFIQ